jgi:hypothetical protein
LGTLTASLALAAGIALALVSSTSVSGGPLFAADESEFHNGTPPPPCGDACFGGDCCGGVGAVRG